MGSLIEEREVRTLMFREEWSRNEHTTDCEDDEDDDGLMTKDLHAALKTLCVINVL